MPDQDHYPTDDELSKIEKWDVVNDKQAFMDFCRSCWWMPDWGWTQKGNRFDISTGGWSGNESVIGAMKANVLFWDMCWISSKRGGHYVFKI